MTFNQSTLLDGNDFFPNFYFFTTTHKTISCNQRRSMILLCNIEERESNCFKMMYANIEFGFRLARVWWTIILFTAILQQAHCNFLANKTQTSASTTETKSNQKVTTIKPSTKNQSSSENDTTYEDWSANQNEIELFWLNSRDAFFNLTSFTITKEVALLLGDHLDNRTSFHLPFWFDYEMFKNLTERVHANAKIELKRHHIYINNCVDILRNSVLKRLHQPNNFTYIDLAEDWTQDENYNEEFGEADMNLTSLEIRESPVAKAMRLVQKDINKRCSLWKDKNACILYFVELDERYGPPMKLRYPFEDERYRSLVELDAAEEASAEFVDSLLSSDGRASYWLDRRQDFFNKTRFPLSKKTQLLVGATYAKKTYHLPFWFDYEVFKRMVTRINETPQEELKAHHKYIDSCVDIWNETASDRLGLSDYEVGGINSHVDIPPHTCLYNCNPFDYDLNDDELRESPTDKALRLVQEELDNCADKKRTILLLAELEERFDFPRARGMRYPFEAEKTSEEFWKYVEDRDKTVAEFVKSLA